MADETAHKIISLLKHEYPDARIALRYSNPLELLISTVLSAQCTDERVNEVTKHLFQKYRTPEDYRNISREELERDIYSTGFYKNKAKNIQRLSEILVEQFGGKVPDTMEELLTFPGVARKTANIVLSSAFGKNVGIAVDTHVKRVSARLGLTKNTNPDNIERDLMNVVPKPDWGIITILLIKHGRRVCTARKPHCHDCVLNELCPSAFTFE